MRQLTYVKADQLESQDVMELWRGHTRAGLPAVLDLLALHQPAADEVTDRVFLSTNARRVFALG